MTPRKVSLPQESVLQPWLQNADFFDAYEADNPVPERTAMAIWLDTVRQTPAWVERAMDVRNAVVSRLGLKDLGNLSSFSALKAAEDYQEGDRVGIFSIRHISDNEIILGDQDKHLEVRLSVCKVAHGKQVVVSTVVHIHNWLGRAYMLFVKPMHRIIAPTVLAKISIKRKS